MEAKHTPGPWSAESNGEVRAMQDGISVVVAKTHDLRWDDLGEIERGNATLIAAAPDLLAALEKLTFLAARQMPTDAIRLQVMSSVIESADAAIAKAKGG